MEPKEDSIKMLEMRMRRQLNTSSEKNIKPENIQYYVSSAMLHKDGIQQGAYMDEKRSAYQTDYDNQTDIWKLTGEEDSFLQEEEESLEMTRSIEKEKEDYWKKLQSCRTKEEVQRVEAECRRLERLGLSMTENNAVLSVERRLEYTLFKDEKIAAIRDMTRRFIESEEYAKLPTDVEYIEKSGEMPPRSGQTGRSEAIEASETKEVQHAKAKNGYESIRRSMDGEDSSGNVGFYSFNAKG